MSAAGDGILVRTSALRRVFDDGTEALADIALTICAGDFTAIVGPSGCGKSTLLRILAGLDTASVNDPDWPGGVPGPGDVGFVFQEPTLLPWASVEDNVRLPLRLTGDGSAAADATVDKAISLVGLDGFRAFRPRQLSGGMRMRVSIARALVTRPRLLLMDEPFAALDEITRFRLNDDLLRVWTAQRSTILFVTHSVFEAVYLAQRVIVLSPRPGRVVADVTIDLPRPRTPEMRTAPEYSALCRQISHHLAETAS